MRRSYNSISDEKISKMMQVTFQQCTEAKIKWAFKCYDDWHNMRLDRDVDCEHKIIDSDLKETAMLRKEKFEFALCRFICEVKKSKEEGDYPGCTLYQMVCAIQNYPKKHNINWRLVHGDKFQNFQ